MDDPNLLDPARWKAYRPGLCTGCWAACCTMPVRVSTEDLFHMGLIEARQVNGPLVRLANRLKREGIVRSFYPRTRTFMLERRKDGSCVFLNADRRCTIYEKRPAVCRSFPYNGIRPGYCPHRKTSPVVTSSKKV